MWAAASVLTFVALMFVAGQMARSRHRSITIWVWVTAFVGPLGPLAIYLLGSHNKATSRL